LSVSIHLKRKNVSIIARYWSSRKKWTARCKFTSVQSHMQNNQVYVMYSVQRLLWIWELFQRVRRSDSKRYIPRSSELLPIKANRADYRF
jgi:hypothetical protein